VNAHLSIKVYLARSRFRRPRMLFADLQDTFSHGTITLKLPIRPFLFSFIRPSQSWTGSFPDALLPFLGRLSQRCTSPHPWPSFPFSFRSPFSSRAVSSSAAPPIKKFLLQDDWLVCSFLPLNASSSPPPPPAIAALRIHLLFPRRICRSPKPGKTQAALSLIIPNSQGPLYTPPPLLFGVAAGATKKTSRPSRPSSEDCCFPPGEAEFHSPPSHPSSATAFPILPLQPLFFIS